MRDRKVIATMQLKYFSLLHFLIVFHDQNQKTI
jgi:hypothetical protein